MAKDDSRMAFKVRLKDLALKRESIEGDIALRSERLEASGVGSSGSLVDKEGFPRADIDVAAVRADRQRIAGRRFLHVPQLAWLDNDDCTIEDCVAV